MHGREIWTLTPPFPGDVDDSGAVDLQDFLILASNFSKTTEHGIRDGDLNENGRVDFADFLMLADAF